MRYALHRILLSISGTVMGIGILAHRILETKPGREDGVIVENNDSVLISLCLPINNDVLANKGQ